MFARCVGFWPIIDVLARPKEPPQRTRTSEDASKRTAPRAPHEIWWIDPGGIAILALPGRYLVFAGPRYTEFHRSKHHRCERQRSIHRAQTCSANMPCANTCAQTTYAVNTRVGNPLYREPVCCEPCVVNLCCEPVRCERPAAAAAGADPPDRALSHARVTPTRCSRLYPSATPPPGVTRSAAAGCLRAGREPPFPGNGDGHRAS